MVRLLVFSDKANKPCAPSRNPPSLFTILRDVKEPTHALLEKSRAQSSRCCGLALLWADTLDRDNL